MATLNTTLAISSTNVSSDSLSLSISDVLAVANPSVGLSRATITTADNQEIYDEALDVVSYIYVKNLDPTNYIKLQTTASVVWGRLHPGEAILFAIHTDAGLELRADTASCIVEYAYWTKA